MDTVTAFNLKNVAFGLLPLSVTSGANYLQYASLVKNDRFVVVYQNLMKQMPAYCAG